jgi:hypothetical protein
VKRAPSVGGDSRPNSVCCGQTLSGICLCHCAIMSFTGLAERTRFARPLRSDRISFAGKFPSLAPPQVAAGKSAAGPRAHLDGPNRRLDLAECCLPMPPRFHGTIAHGTEAGRDIVSRCFAGIEMFGRRRRCAHWHRERLSAPRLASDEVEC